MYTPVYTMWQPVEPAWWLPYLAATLLCSLIIHMVIQDYSEIQRIVRLRNQEFFQAYLIAVVVILTFHVVLSFYSPVAGVTLSIELIRQRLMPAADV